MASADVASASVRQANARACLLQLRESEEALTVAEVAARTGLSRPTVTSVVDHLLAVGTLREVEASRASAPGRPARHLAFDPRVATVAAVDLGARSVRCVLADAAGTVLAEQRRELDPVGPDQPARSLEPSRCLEPTRTPEADRLWDAVAGVLEAARAQATDATGAAIPAPAVVGLAVPGILTADGTVAQSLAVEDLVGTDPSRELSARLGCPVVVENDIKLAAYAEHHLSGAADGTTTDIAFVQIGHRISVALVVGGRILQGAHRLAGELGTQRGMRWTATSRRGRLQWSTGEDAEPLFARAADGEGAARAEIDAFCAEIAPRLAALLLAVDPQKVVIGGGLSRAGATLLDPLRRHLDHQLMSSARPELVPARLTTDGALVGALGTAFEQGSERVLAVPGMSAPWHRFPRPADPHPEGTP